MREMMWSGVTTRDFMFGMTSEPPSMSSPFSWYLSMSTSASSRVLGLWKQKSFKILDSILTSSLFVY